MNETETMEQEARGLVPVAQSFEITTQEDHDKAAAFLANVKAFQEKVKAHYAPHKKRADDVVKGLRGEEKTYLAPAEEAEKIVKDKIAPLTFKSPGISRSKKVEVVITDKDAALNAILHDESKWHLLTIDESALAAQVERLDGNINIPGVRVETRIIVRAGK